eukprot:jgi/Tetstr1/454656/TSEL_041546.t1
MNPAERVKSILKAPAARQRPTWSGGSWVRQARRHHPHLHVPAETAEASLSAEAAQQPDDEDGADDDIELSGDSSFRRDRDEMDLVSSEDEDDMEIDSGVGTPAAKEFPQLVKALNNHSITGDCHIQFFTKPLIAKCDCMAYKKELNC